LIKPAIGLLGGTFDPIHYGHLRPAHEAMRALGLDSLRVIPAFQPPHRAAPVAPPEHRLAMARLACAEFPEFVLDDREYRRGGPSWTVDTLASLRAELGDDVPLCWLVGADSFAGIDTWHEARRLPALAHFIVLARPGAAPPAPPDWLGPRLTADRGRIFAAPCGAVLPVPVAPHDISGTAIRARLAAGEPVTGLLPDSVARYIHQHRLYGSH
jgi:nicotinate-nucleotide adenylyltransferase